MAAVCESQPADEGRGNPGHTLGSNSHWFAFPVPLLLRLFPPKPEPEDAGVTSGTGVAWLRLPVAAPKPDADRCRNPSRDRGPMVLGAELPAASEGA